MSTSSSSASGRRSKRVRRKSSSSSSSRDSESRMKEAHDPRLVGLTEAQALEIYQEEYRPVQSSEILDVLPECKYGSVVMDGKITIRAGWTKVPLLAEKLFSFFPDCVKDYPQLGNFLLLNGKGKLPGAAIHQLFARLCNWPKKNVEYTRLFLVNKMVARFSLVEFSLITGLHFMDERTDEDLEKPKNLKEIAFPKYYDNETEVPIKELFKEIDQYLSGSYGAPETKPIVINLTFAWLITKVLILPNRKETVPDEIFELCSDLDACQKYPWGLKVWKVVVDNCLIQVGDINGDGHRNWNSYGFMFIIVYWMIEAFEGAAVQLGASPRKEYFHSHPRMLRWELGSSSPKNKDFQNFLVKEVKVVYPRLKPDIMELQSGYFWRSLKYYERKILGEPDRLRFSDDYTFCSDYVKFQYDPVQPVDDSAPPEMFDQGDPSSFQTGPSGGPFAWWADFLQMNTDREERNRLRAERFFLEMSSQRDLIKDQGAQIVQFGVQMGQFGVQLSGIGDQIVELGGKVDELGRRIDSVEEGFRRFEYRR